MPSTSALKSDYYNQIETVKKRKRRRQGSIGAIGVRYADYGCGKRWRRKVSGWGRNREKWLPFVVARGGGGRRWREFGTTVNSVYVDVLVDICNYMNCVLTS